MSRFEIWRCALLAGLVAACAMPAAQAQDIPSCGEGAYASATPGDTADIANDKIVDRVPVEIDEATLVDALNASLPAFKKAKSFRPAVSASSSSWEKVSNRDGSAKYSVNKPLAAPWDTKVGAEINAAAPPPDIYEPRQLPATTASADSGSAWANVAVPHVASVEVRAEPANGYDRFNTKLERSLPLGGSISVTLQGGFGVTDLHATSVMPTSTTLKGASRLLDTDKSLQFNIRSTGTTLLAGSTTVSGDPVAHNRLTAAQKLYGPLSVTGSIYDVGQPASSKSITAGMNFAW